MSENPSRLVRDDRFISEVLTGRVPRERAVSQRLSQVIPPPIGALIAASEDESLGRKSKTRSRRDFDVSRALSSRESSDHE